MILNSDRKIALWLFRLKVWGLSAPHVAGNWRCHRLRVRPGWEWTQPLWNWMRKRQTRDGLHHAPYCPGNEWSGAELVFQGCNCGAAYYAKTENKEAA